MSQFPSNGCFSFRLAAAGSLVGLLLAVCPAHASGLPTTAPPPPPLNWQPCPNSPFANRDCATLTVPLNYANLADGTIDLPVARARATGDKIGVLVFHPGGPGNTVVNTIGTRNIDGMFTPTLQSRFDIVGFDPRGTTNGLGCMSPAEREQYWESNLLPRTTAEINTRLDTERQLNQNCLNNNDPLARHADSASTVRDVEQLRRALGVETISSFGASYGTFTGHRYARLYPGRVRALVLDAPTDRGIPVQQYLQELNAVYESRWAEYKAWCEVPANNCKMRGQNIDAVFDQVLASARVNPLPAPRSTLAGLAVTQRAVNDWILTMMAQVFAANGTKTFNWLDQLVYESSLGDGSVARLYYDISTGYDYVSGNGSYSPDTSSWRAITCVDTNWSQLVNNAADLQALIQQSKAAAPRFGEAGVSQLPTQCVGYPVAPVEPPPLPYTLFGLVGQVPPVLIVGGTLDSYTPYLWATRLASKLPTSRLLTRVGYGHVSYTKSRCIQQNVDDYLINLTLPASGTSCPTDADLFKPDPLIIPPLP